MYTLTDVTKLVPGSMFSVNGIVSPTLAEMGDALADGGVKVSVVAGVA